MIAPAAAKRIKLVGLDVDGVLTDGGVYLGDVDGKRTELKRYDIQDGVGILLLRQCGIKVAIVTGRESHSVRLRAAELNVDAVEQDSNARKLPAMRRVMAKLEVAPDECAFIGDDLPDLGILKSVGMGVAVSNATREVREAAHVHLTKAGGAGAVREFAEWLLAARGEWDGAIAQFLADRAADAAP